MIDVFVNRSSVWPSDIGQSSSSVRLRSGGSGSCRRRRLLRPGSEPLQVNIVSRSLILINTHVHKQVNKVYEKYTLTTV